MAATLVTLTQAKLHLRETGTASDVDIQQKLDHAEALILDYIGSTDTWRTTIAGWLADPTTTPPVVTAAILVQLGELDRFRGDDETDALPSRLRARNESSDDLSVLVVELLRRTRDPVLA
jgi:hypothetical protein